MATRDFRSQQIRITQIIASGSNPLTTPSLLIYSASAATNDAGGYPVDMLANVGEDVWMFVSGSTDPTQDEAQVLFGGNIVVSGSITGSNFNALVGSDMTLRSDGNISFILDNDENESSQYFEWLNNSSTQIAKLFESGNLQIDGDLQVDGGDATIIAANDGNAVLHLKADNSDDAGDDWTFTAHAGSQTLRISNDIASAGSPVAHVTITPHATVASSTVATAGIIKVGGNIIQASDGGNTITMDTSDNVTILGDLKVSGGDIRGPTDGILYIHSDLGVIIDLDADNDGSQSFKIRNGQDNEILILDESGNLEVDGSVTLATDIIHQDDADTKISFTEDKIAFTAGGVGFFEVVEAGQDLAVFNEAGGDVDFRVETANKAAMIHTVASQDAIKFGGNALGDVVENDVNFKVIGIPGAHQAMVLDPTTVVRGVALFTGDLIVSGTLYAEKQVMEVDMVQSGSNLILSSSLHFKNTGAGAGSNVVVPPNDGSIYVSTGSLYAKLATGEGVTTEVLIGQNYIDGDGLTSTTLNPNTTFHMSIAAITGSAMPSGAIAIADLIAVADDSVPDKRTRKISAEDFVESLAGPHDTYGLFKHVAAGKPYFRTDDAIVAHLTGSVFSGQVGITGTAGLSLTTVNKVGIGVSDPDSMLEIMDPETGSRAQLKLSYDTDSFSTLSTDSSGNLTISAANSDADIKFVVDDNGTDVIAFTIDGGKFGSAKFTPLDGGSLEVNDAGTDGFVRIRGDGDIELYDMGDHAGSAEIRFYKTRGTEGSTSITSDGDALGQLKFFGYDTASGAHSARIGAFVDGEPGTASDSTDSPGKLQFSTSPEGTSVPVTRMTIRQDGKIGVRTTDPKNQFVVSSGSLEVFGGDFIINRDDGADVDSILQFQLDSGITQTWTMGIDDSDADKFKIKAGSALGSASDVEIDTSGNMVLKGDLTVGGNDIKDSGGDARISFPDAGALVISDADSSTVITVHASNLSTTLAGNLRVSGGNIDGPVDGDLNIRSDGNMVLRLDNDNDEDSQSFQIQNNGSTEVFTVNEAGHVSMDGTLQVSGNVIKASDGGSTITMDTSDNVTIGNYLKVGGNIIQASDGGNTITMDTNDKVTIAGNLEVDGGLATVTAGNNAAAAILLQADNSDDAGDDWKILATAAQTFELRNDIASAGSYVAQLTVTPHATATDSVLTAAGKVKVGGNQIQDSGGSAAITFDGSANTTIPNDLLISQNLIHAGDADTKIVFSDDSIKFNAGAIEFLRFTEAADDATIFNSGQADIDFKVKSVNSAHAFVVNAANNQVLILSGGHSTSQNTGQALDANFFVSGSIGSKNSAEVRGTAVFGGDLVISGTLYDSSGYLKATAFAQNSANYSAYNPSAAGANAVAIGKNSVASGNNSIAMGSSTTNQTDATGLHAAALGGDDATASGDYSTVLGGYAGTASGDYSTVVGGTTNAASGDYSITAGNANTASAPNSIAIGQGNTASASNAIAIGKSLTVNTANGIGIGNNANDAVIQLKGTVETLSTLTIPSDIIHAGDADTKIAFTDDRIQIDVGGLEMFSLKESGATSHIKLNGDSNANVDFIVKTGTRVGIALDSGLDKVLILSGGHSTSQNTGAALDAAFFVSGSIGSKDSATDRGASVFGGDVHISGSLSGPSAYALTDNSVKVYRTSNTMYFKDGENVAKTLSDLASLSTSTTHFTAVHGGTPQTAKLKATGSIAFSGGEDAYVDGMAASGVGLDVFTFFSGSVGARQGWAAAGANQFKTDGRAIAMFGGDVVFSGSAQYLGNTSFTDIEAIGSLIAGGDVIKNSNNDTSIKFSASTPNVLFGDAAVVSQTPQSNVHVAKASNVQAAAANAYADFGLSIRNNSVQTNAFAGISFDVSTELDADSIGAAIRAERDTSATTDVTLHDANLTFSTNDAGDAGLTERMRITHDGKVGIGVSDPAYALDINGDINLRSGGSFRIDGTTTAITGAEFEVLDGVSAGTVLASKVVVVDGNKDIGTIRNLTIDGTFSDGNYTFDTSGNVTGLGTVGCGAITSTGVSDFGSVTVDNITIDGTEIDLSSGNLTLDVAGNIILDADGGNITLKDANNYGLNMYQANAGDWTFESLTQNKDIIFKVNDSGTPLDVLRMTGIDRPGVIINEAGNQEVDFRVESRNSTHMLYVDGYDDFVGVGVHGTTLSPAPRFHVEHSNNTTAAASNVLGNFTMLLKNLSTTTNAFAGIAFDVTSETDEDSIGAAIRAERDTSASTTAGLHDANLTFATNDSGDDGLTERMRITHDGLVGIGTASPSHSLDVTGDARITGDLIVDGGGITFGNAQAAKTDIADTAHNVAGQDVAIWAGNTTAGTTNNIAGGDLTLYAGKGKGTGAGGDIKFYIAKPGNSGNSLNTHSVGMIIEDGGDVGIGIANPDTKLEILSTSSQLKLSYDGSNAAAFTVSSGGDLTIVPSGGDASLTGNLDVSAKVAIGGQASVTTDTTLVIDDNHAMAATGAGQLSIKGALTTNNNAVATNNNTQFMLLHPDSTTLAAHTDTISVAKILEPQVSLGGNTLNEAMSLEMWGMASEATGHHLHPSGSTAFQDNWQIWGSSKSQFAEAWIGNDKSTASNALYSQSTSAVGQGDFTVFNNNFPPYNQLAPKRVSLKATFDGVSTSYYATSFCGHGQTVMTGSSHYSLPGMNSSNLTVINDVGSLNTGVTWTETWTGGKYDGSNLTRWNAGDRNWGPNASNADDPEGRIVIRAASGTDEKMFIYFPLLNVNCNNINDYLSIYFEDASDQPVTVGRAKSYRQYNGTTWTIMNDFTDRTYVNIPSPFYDGSGTGTASDAVGWRKVEIWGTNLHNIHKVRLKGNGTGTGDEFKVGGSWFQEFIQLGESDDVAGSTNGSTNGFSAGLLYEDVIMDGTSRPSELAYLCFSLAKGDGTSFERTVDTTALAALDAGDAMILQLSFDNGTNWELANNTFYKKGTGIGNGSEQPSGTTMKQDYTALSTVGKILGSEMSNSQWDSFIYPMPLHQDRNMDDFQWRIACDGLDSTKGFVVHKASIAWWFERGLKLYKSGQHSIIKHMNTYGDLKIVGPDFDNSGAEHEYMHFEAGASNNIGINTSSPAATLSIKQSNDVATGGTRLIQYDSSVYWDTYVNSNDHLLFKYNGGANGGYLRMDADVTQITFTGQHRSIPVSGVAEDFADKIGMIVVSSGDYSSLADSDSMPSINESLPSVSLSVERNQKTAFGVISDYEDLNSNEREYAQGAWVTTLEKQEGDERLIINSLGEGAVWVSNINGNLENGDYITTCEIPGLGMKQDDDLLHNYTVAKITQECTFRINAANYEVVEFEHEGQSYRKAFVGCTYHCG